MIRFTHILIAMGLILLAGVLSAKHLEDRIGVSAVPGLVLVDCPELQAGTLERMRGRWTGATLEWVAADPGVFQPFDPSFVVRHVARGDATALFSSGALDRAETDVAAWPVVLGGFPGAEPHDRAEAASEAVVSFMQGRSGSRPFLVGVALELGIAAPEISQLVDRLLEAAKSYPESRRTALVVLGEHDREAIAGRANQRWCLRIPIGDWSHKQQAGLRDLLEVVEAAPSGTAR